MLCFDCHRETQIRGGFDRKLNAEQVVLYRDDWYRSVASRRTRVQASDTASTPDDGHRLDMVTGIAEIYRENEEYELLAMHYHVIGNAELRDKYIEIALKETPSDNSICFLRGLQEKPELIPEAVVERELQKYTDHRDWTQRARFYKSLGKDIEAAQDYVEGVKKSLAEDNAFSAAYYLKELVKEGLIDALFVEAFKRAKADNDLWWQIRALDELGWRTELKSLLSENEEEIEKSGNLLLLQELARAKGDSARNAELMKDIARHTHSARLDNATEADADS